MVKMFCYHLPIMTFEIWSPKLKNNGVYQEFFKKFNNVSFSFEEAGDGFREMSWYHENVLKRIYQLN